VGQHKHLVGRQRQPARLALRGKGRLAVQRGNVAGVGVAAVGVARQQHAQLFKALADGGNGLREVQVALAGRRVACACARAASSASMPPPGNT
jgi:hypothetical protein